LSRVGLVVHERLGRWARQLRSRLSGPAVRLKETRSWTDLEEAITGLIAPVVLIDLKDLGDEGLVHLARLSEQSSDARVLVLGPSGDEDRKQLARELGATHVLAGASAPEETAQLLGAWVKLAAWEAEHGGWQRRLEPDPRLEPWAWLAEYGVALGGAGIWEGNTKNVWQV